MPALLSLVSQGLERGGDFATCRYSAHRLLPTQPLHHYFPTGDAVVVLSATGKGMDAVYTLRKAGAAEGEEPNPKFTAHADMLERDPLAYLLRKFRVLITEDIEEETFNSLEEVGEADYDEMLEKLEALSATREVGGEN